MWGRGCFYVFTFYIFTFPVPPCALSVLDVQVAGVAEDGGVHQGGDDGGTALRGDLALVAA